MSHINNENTLNESPVSEYGSMKTVSLHTNIFIKYPIPYEISPMLSHVIFASIPLKASTTVTCKNYITLM